MGDFDSEDANVLTDKKADTATSTRVWRSKSGEIAFFALLAGASAIGGFGSALKFARKNDPFPKGPDGSVDVNVRKGSSVSNVSTEAGQALALRALKHATMYAVGGCSLLGLIIWGALGFPNSEELSAKLHRKVPQTPKHEPRGRSEFSSIRELVHYLIDEDEKAKVGKKES